MKLTINGHIKDMNNAVNIAAIAGEFCTNNKNVIAEVNGTILSRPDWNTLTLKEGDTIELVGFVGGG